MSSFHVLDSEYCPGNVLISFLGPFLCLFDPHPQVFSLFIHAGAYMTNVMQGINHKMYERPLDEMSSLSVVKR